MWRTEADGQVENLRWLLDMQIVDNRQLGLHSNREGGEGICELPGNSEPFSSAFYIQNYTINVL